MKIVVISVILISLFFFKVNSVFAGLGISPAQMLIDNLSPGAHVEKTFVLSRDNYQEDLDFQVSIEGLAKDWVSVDRGDKFTIPAGEQRFSIVVSVDVPVDALVGNYSGGVRLTPLESDFTNVSALTNVSTFIQINFKIGNVQIFDNKDQVISEDFDSKQSLGLRIVKVVGALFIVVFILILGLYLRKKKIYKI